MSDKKENLTFGEAIIAMKNGFKVSRKGWNGKNMFLWMKKGSLIKSEWCHDELLKSIIDSNGGEMEALPCVCMKTANNKIVSGWVSSQADMFSEDWFIVD